MKHKCLMGEISEINILTELCTKTKPALLSTEKLCLHYVIHYINRGTWDHLLADPSQADRARVDGYQCNVCGKKFRNNHSKQEYPARGSFICHWATEHGKVLEAMKSDSLVDMTGVISLVTQHDQRLSNFLRDGTKTIYDKNPVKVIEALTCRVQKDSSRIAIRRKTKSVIQCPKCSAFDKNRDPNNLKLHLFHHYLDHWSLSVPQLDREETVCDQCQPAKKIVGANPEGCRIALICHRAIHHDELRDALAADHGLPPNFLQELYGEPASKPVTVLHAGQTDSSQDSQHQPGPDIDQERERIALEVRKRQIIKTFENRKKEDNSKKRKLPYVGKRIKQNLQNIDFDEDSDDDREWNYSHSDSDDPGDNIQMNLDQLSRKILPRRQVAPSKFSHDESDLE